MEKSLKDQVYESILEDIFQGNVSPGDILNEKALLEKYHCSKSPVREALMALCADGILKNIPRYGYEVVRLSKEDIYDNAGFPLCLGAGECFWSAERSLGRKTFGTWSRSTVSAVKIIRTP